MLCIFFTFVSYFVLAADASTSAGDGDFLEPNTLYLLNNEAFSENGLSKVTFRFNSTEAGYRLKVTYHRNGSSTSLTRSSILQYICYDCKQRGNSVSIDGSIDIFKVYPTLVGIYEIDYFAGYWDVHMASFSTIEAVYEPLLTANNSCGTLDGLSTNRSGSIHISHYSPTTRCEWILAPEDLADNEQVFLRVSTIDIEAHFDRLLVFDGDYGDTVLIDSRTMNNTLFVSFDSIVFEPPDWPRARSSAGKITISFEADESIELTGFFLTWTVEEDLQLTTIMDFAAGTPAWNSFNISGSGNFCNLILPGITCWGNSVVAVYFLEIGLTTIPTSISFLGELRVLYIYECDLRASTLPLSITQLKFLRELVIETSVLGLPLPADLNSLSSLDTLSISDCVGTGGPMPALDQLNLLALGISDCAMESRDVSWVSSYDRLETLDLSGNRIASSLPDIHESAFETLGSIYLQNNMFSGSVPSSWQRRFTRDTGDESSTEESLAVIIDLSNNLLVSEAPLLRVSILNLSHNMFSDATLAPEGWEYNNLYLSGNPFSCPVYDYSTWSTSDGFNDYIDYEQPESCIGGELDVMRQIAETLSISSGDWSFDLVHYCFFPGVSCRAPDNYIERLDFTEINLSGVLTNVFAELPHLESLTIGSNQSSLFCPLPNYSSWFNETDFQVDQLCFACNASLLEQEFNVVSTNDSSGCTEADVVGTSCTMQCRNGYQLIGGALEFSCSRDGYVGSPICVPKCALDLSQTNNTVLSNTCHSAGVDEVCELDCVDDFVPGTDFADGRLDRLTCLPMERQLSFNAAPLTCTPPCYVSETERVRSNLVVVDGCEHDIHLEICTTRCQEYTSLSTGVHSRVCRFDGTIHQYTREIAVCEGSDWRVALVLGLFVVAAAFAAVIYTYLRFDKDVESGLVLATVVFSIFDVSCHIAFVHERQSKIVTDGRAALVYLAAGFIAIAMAINLICVYYANRKFRMRLWRSNRGVLETLAIALSTVTAEVVSLIADRQRITLRSNDNNSNALNSSLRRWLQIGALSANLVEDIPLLCIHIAFASWTHWTTISILSLSATVMSISFALFKYFVSTCWQTRESQVPAGASLQQHNEIELT